VRNTSPTEAALGALGSCDAVIGDALVVADSVPGAVFALWTHRVANSMAQSRGFTLNSLLRNGTPESGTWTT
jgi:hypothetical protein